MIRKELCDPKAEYLMKPSLSGVLRPGELSDPARRARLAALQHHRRHPSRAEGPPERR